MSVEAFRRLRKVLIPVAIVWAALVGNAVLAKVASADLAQNASWRGRAAVRAPHKPEAALTDELQLSAQDTALKIQMAMILDGSGSINLEEWSIIINGLAAAVENPACIPQDGSMQLTLIQFGDITARLEVGPVVIDSMATATTAASQIRNINQLRWRTPIATGICLAANVLRYHPDAQFDPNLKQALNLVTDGVPNMCGTCDPCPTVGPPWECIATHCLTNCSVSVCPPAEDASVVARNYALSLLEMDPAQDEFDAEGVGITDTDKEWLRTSIVWPGSYEWVPPEPPPGAGWVRVVPDAQAFADSVCDKFKRVVGLDFGDAPDSNDPTIPAGYNYPTLRVSNGARHLIGDIRMGTLIDAELDGQPIDQDDVLPPGAPDDEDGVILLGAGPPGGPYALPYIAGQNGAVQITISSTNATAGTGFLHGWFDWNQDGDWNDLNENVFSGVTVPLAPGVVTINFPVPSSALPAPPGVTWARFRLDDQNLNTVDGLADNGEVEDYNEAVVCPRLIVEVAAEPDSGCAPLTVSLAASVSGGTPPYQYHWDLGDGAFSTLKEPVHTYSAGTYTVTLTVTDSHGCSTIHTDPGLITVYALPTARFTADPSSGFAPLTVQFSDISTLGDAPIAEWYWDFGDGGTSTRQNPSYTYNEPGAYTVTLAVTDSYGCSDMVWQPNSVLAGELEVSKQRPHGIICATHTFWYYICVTNTSEVPMPANNLVITDVLPDGIAPYSVRVSEPGVFDGSDTVTWNLGTLEPSNSICVWIQAQTYSLAAGTHITNRAWIDADNLQEPILATDVAFVYRPPCPPRSTVTPLPTATATASPTAAQTPTATPTPTATATPTTGSIVACVWNDLDGDGFQDIAEPGLGGVVIELQDSQDPFVDFCSTDTSGFCTFGDLQPGTYTVTAGAAQGFFFTTGPAAQVEVFAGQLSEVFFGSRQFYTLLLPVIMKNAALPVYLPPMLKYAP